MSTDTTLYAFNFSMIGCLADNDPMIFESEAEARSALVDELNERAEQAAESEECMREGGHADLADDQLKAVESYREAAEHIAASKDTSVVANGWHFWITDDVEADLY